MWYRNIILKERQRGFTTFIDLYILDECIFNSDIEGAIVAHTRDSAQKIFRRKIKYPYDQLSPEIRNGRPLITDSKSELAFSNNSTVYVDTSLRSGTAQYLHISELGAVCAKFPEKAREVITGSIPAVQPGQIIWIESTAEGREGYFYDYCQDAQNIIKEGRELTQMDFKFFFVGWWQDPENVLEQVVPVTDADNEYFRRIEGEIGHKITQAQRHWYVIQKKLINAEEMKKQYPSTPNEAFEAAIEGAFFAHQMSDIREQGRLTDVPFTPGIPVDTWWDLGGADSNCIWMTQNASREIHVIDYYEHHGTGLLHYAKYLDWIAKERNWRYGRHVAPWDIAVFEIGPGKTRITQAKNLKDESTGKTYCINFEAAPKILKEQDGWEASRNILPRCWFDQKHTTKKFGNKSVGFPSLEGYRREWDEKLGSFKNTPFHNWASHGAKAFETMAIAHDRTGGVYDNLDDVFG